MTDLDKWMLIIKDIASEQKYRIANGDKLQFQIFIKRWNAVAFQVYANKSSGYIEISQWEGNTEEEAKYGRSVYSLRSYSDVNHFCNILIASSTIRARRSV